MDNPSPWGDPEGPAAHPQYQKSTHFARSGQSLAPSIFDRVLEVLLASPGQLLAGAQILQELGHVGHQCGGGGEEACEEAEEAPSPGTAFRLGVSCDLLDDLAVHLIPEVLLLAQLQQLVQQIHFILATGLRLVPHKLH